MKKIEHVLATAVLSAVAVLTGYAQPDWASVGAVAPGSRPTVDLATTFDTDNDGNFDAAVTTLTNDNVYVLPKRMYVTDGKVLNIEAGTVIKGTKQGGNPENAASLIICQGGKIYAQGAETCPVIFTVIDDPVDGTFSTCIDNRNDRWGGLIILGKAQNNVKAGDGSLIAYDDSIGNIEGLPVPDARHHYGKYPEGPTGQFYNDDCSGELKYVSIRNSGAIIGEANEINGLTLGSVGRGTKIEYVEVFNTQDDGWEFFGGTVNVRHCVTMFQGDDGFDWDQDYDGFGQFLYVVQHPDTISTPSQGSSGMEIDGDDKGPKPTTSNAVFFNLTAIGVKWPTNYGIEAKERTAGEVSNSIFANFTRGREVKANSPDFEMHNNLYVDVTNLGNADNGTTITGSVFPATGTGIDANLEAVMSDCIITGSIKPVPSGNVATTYQAPINGFFVTTNYAGAFAPNEDPWTEGWTMASEYKFDPNAVSCPTDVNDDGVTDGSDYLDLVNEFGESCVE
ncbi:MAG: hypothetical protein JXB00_03330 [Bacteroidales bacterium]|nr:hypothetical protein [Bacteroidales bacterium]